MFNRSAPFLFAAALLTISSVASAADLGQRSSQIQIGDLNLATGAGHAVLMHRVESAADTVCGGQADLRDLQHLTNFRACRASAIAAVAPKLHAMIAAAQMGPQVAMATPREASSW